MRRQRWISPWILSSTIAIATVGCYEFGAPFSRSHEGDLRPGLDQATIRGWFGEPLSKTPLVGQKCTERWLWFYGRSAMGTASHSLAISFDDKGTVCTP